MPRLLYGRVGLPKKIRSESPIVLGVGLDIQGRKQDTVDLFDVRSRKIVSKSGYHRDGWWRHVCKGGDSRVGHTGRRVSRLSVITERGIDMVEEERSLEKKILVVHLTEIGTGSITV